MGAFLRKLRPEEMVNPEHLYIGFDEEWKVVEKCDRIKGIN